MNPIKIDYAKCVEMLQDTNIVHNDGVAIYSFVSTEKHSYPYVIDGFLLSLLEQGSLSGSINGETYVVNAPALTLFPREQIVRESEHSMDRKSTQIFLSNEFLEQFCPKDIGINQAFFGIPSIPLSCDELVVYKYLFDVIADNIISDEEVTIQRLQAAMTLLLHGNIADRFKEIINNTQYSPVVSQFLLEVRKSAVSHKDGMYYAKKTGLSLSQLERRLKKETGKSVLQWVDWFRIEYCKNQLLYSDQRVLVLAEELGFSTAEYFSRYFKAHTGMSPMQYKERHQDRCKAKRWLG